MGGKGKKEVAVMMGGGLQTGSKGLTVDLIKNTHQRAALGTAYTIFTSWQFRPNLSLKYRLYTAGEYYLSPPHLWGGTVNERETKSEQGTIKVKERKTRTQLESVRG